MVYNPTQVDSTLLVVQIPQKLQPTVLYIFECAPLMNTKSPVFAPLNVLL